MVLGKTSLKNFVFSRYQCVKKRNSSAKSFPLFYNGQMIEQFDMLSEQHLKVWAEKILMEAECMKKLTLKEVKRINGFQT